MGNQVSLQASRAEESPCGGSDCCECIVPVSADRRSVSVASVAAGSRNPPVPEVCAFSSEKAAVLGSAWPSNLGMRFCLCICKVGQLHLSCR